MDVYHQLGHHANWNLESMAEDKVGDGIIIPARFMEDKHIRKLDVKIRQKAIFDPQFYEPSIPKGKLGTYDFFPQIAADGFATTEYEQVALESAYKCVAFQLRNDFRYIIIPTRYKSGMPTDFTKLQEGLFIDHFLETIEQQQTSKAILLQLILNEHMIKDEMYSRGLLNWITGIQELDGVYLIVETESYSKQIKDFDFLYRYLDFMNKLTRNHLQVVLGYLNTESILFSIAMPQIVTIGTYEATRVFSIEKFRTLDNPPQQGPSPRLYISQLLQWVEKPYIDAIKRTSFRDKGIFDANKYEAHMFEPTTRWYFNKPELYKHALLVMYDQLKSISELDGALRYQKVYKLMRDAYNLYQMLSDEVFFDSNSDGSHLGVWINAAMQFAKDQGW